MIALARVCFKSVSLIGASVAGTMKAPVMCRGFGYVDDFLSPEVVKRILAETGPLHDFFEPGEIWVGKEAQAGAQVCARMYTQGAARTLLRPWALPCSF